MEMLMIFTLASMVGAFIVILLCLNTKSHHKVEAKELEDTVMNLSITEDKLNETSKVNDNLRDSISELDSETYEMELFIQDKMDKIDLFYERINKICVNRGYPSFSCRPVTCVDTGSDFKEE